MKLGALRKDVEDSTLPGRESGMIIVSVFLRTGGWKGFTVFGSEFFSGDGFFFSSDSLAWLRESAESFSDAEL